MAENKPKMDRFTRVPISEQDPDVRNHNFEEVCLGYTAEEAVKEAKRCLQCKKPLCRPGCPVSIDIPISIDAIHHELLEAFSHFIQQL